jgi:hypothetical protein
MKMERQIKRQIITRGVIVLLAAAFVCGIILWISSWGAKQDQLFQIRYGVEIPSEYKEIFSMTNTGWWSEGFSYTVYQADPEDTTLRDDFNSGREKDVETLAKRAAEYLQITGNHQIDFRDDYSYRVIRDKRHFSNYLLILHENKSNKYYFIEKFAGRDAPKQGQLFHRRLSRGRFL